jgi:hypothetical protein
MHDDAGSQAEEAIDLAHLGAVARCQIVVHGDHVHAAAGECVQIDGQGGDQRLAFAGFHLGDLAVIEHHATDELHVEMAQTEHAFGGLAHHGESLGQQIVERGTGGNAFAEFHGLGGERVVGEGHDRGLAGVHPRHTLLIRF